MHKFVTFCQENNLVSMNCATGDATFPEVTPVLMCYYAAWAVDNNIKSYTSLCQYTSAVRTYCKASSRPNPTIDAFGGPDPQFYGVMRGIKRELIVDHQIKRTPVTR